MYLEIWIPYLTGYFKFCSYFDLYGYLHHFDSDR